MKKCLIVVDFQNDFVDGSLGFTEAKEIEDVIVEKCEETLKDNGDILFTLDTHYDDYLTTQEGIKLPVIHCIDNTTGHKVYGKVANYVDKAKKVFKKSSFGSIELANYLEQQNYDVVEICGLVTNMCVLSTAVLAKSALSEAKVVVDTKATRSFNKDLHNKTFDILKGIYVDVK